ncbi:hypothetical protein E3P81_04110 [Wallemia ichthyophaga]|nr:hypothetical protein E3P97_04119 [Wallemia ichthyophaga]TIB45122.1 hypothetical protein E3P81_04110 [Wallemia ichthyophaga]TIB54358.1 hypothetical protein E3P79_04112 [Wallemia ichthyophaga]
MAENDISNKSPFNNKNLLIDDISLRRHSMIDSPTQPSQDSYRRPTLANTTELDFFNLNLNDEPINKHRSSYVAPGPGPGPGQVAAPDPHSSSPTITHKSSSDNFNLNNERRGSRFDFASQSSPLSSQFPQSLQPLDNSALGLELNQRNPFNQILPKLSPIQNHPPAHFFNLPPLPLSSPTQPRFFPFDVQSQSQSQTQQPQSSLNDLGKGTPTSSIPPLTTLFIVEFKAARSDLFYSLDTSLSSNIHFGDLVIVEADRGKDLGKVTNDSLTIEDLNQFQFSQSGQSVHPIHSDFSMPTSRPSISVSPLDDAPSPTSSVHQLPAASATHNNHNPAFEALKTVSKDLQPKKIFAKASTSDTQLLITKRQDESKALQICISKVKQRNLPMEVIDAEYQWDRRKLTFYFISEQRIDFRELVRELFRGFKTRIWMSNISATASVQLVQSLQAQAQAQAQAHFPQQMPPMINIHDPPSPLTSLNDLPKQ